MSPAQPPNSTANEWPGMKSSPTIPRQREQIDALVGTLRQLIADADDRAGISRTLIADMQQMVEQDCTLQSDTETFVQSVGDVSGQ